MQWYVGIDLSTDAIQISAMNLRMKEPESFAQDKDSERFQIPTVLAQKIATGDWLFGDEADALSDNDQFVVIDDIYGMALRKESVTLRGEKIPCTMLFGLLLQRCIHLVFSKHTNVELEKLVFTVKEITPQVIALIEDCAERLHVPREIISLQDYRESFYTYALSEYADLCSYEVVLFDCGKEELHSYHMQLNHRTSPQIVMLKEESYPNFGKGMLGRAMKNEAKDLAFADLAAKEFEGKIISAVFLVGDGFDGGWMNESTKVLCRNRRVFMGKNLYTKGAVYSAIKGLKGPWNYCFLGDEKTKANICLGIIQKGRQVLSTLVSAGENWYETSGQNSVILEEGNTIDLVLRSPDKSASKVQTLELTGLPERPPKTTRLTIDAKPLAKDRIRITVRDDGFGSLYPTSGMHWEFELTI